MGSLRCVVVRSFAACVLSLLLWSLASAAGTPREAEVEVRAALTTWRDAFNSRNSRDVCVLVAPDLISSVQGRPDNGYNAVCNRLRRALSDSTKSLHYSLKINEILVSGDLAVVRLIWTLAVRPKGASNSSVTEEIGMDVFRRQPDQSWKISRFVSYPETP